jgi:hypothetical protein
VITPAQELQFVAESHRSNISAVVLDDYQFNRDFLNWIYANLSRITGVIPVVYYFSLIYFLQILEYPASILYELNYSTHVVLVIRPSLILQTEGAWSSFTKVAIVQTEIQFPKIIPCVLMYATHPSFYELPVPNGYLRGVKNGSYYSTGLGPRNSH